MSSIQRRADILVHYSLFYLLCFTRLISNKSGCLSGNFLIKIIICKDMTVITHIPHTHTHTHSHIYIHILGGGYLQVLLSVNHGRGRVLKIPSYIGTESGSSQPRYLLHAPPYGQLWHKAFFRWVRAQNRSPHAPGISKKCLRPRRHSSGEVQSKINLSPKWFGPGLK